jgi:hypothetical protein
MSYLVVLIVDNPDQVPEILSAWEEAGALGITILESSGLGRFRRAGLRDDMPLMPSLRDLFEGNEEAHRTLFTVVDDQALVDRLIAAAQKVAGDLDDPNTGFLFVVPVITAMGMGKHRRDRTGE